MWLGSGSPNVAFAHCLFTVVTRCFHTRNHVHICGLKIKARLLWAVMRRHAASVSVRLHYRKRQPHITLSALMPCTSLCHMQTTATAADINLFFREKYLGRSRECHFVYAHVRSNRSPRRWTVSRQNIDDSRWKPSLSKQYRRKQSLAEITTEPSKTASGVRESGPNPRSLPAENRGNIKKKKVSKTRQWKRRQKEEGVGANTAFSTWTLR